MKILGFEFFAKKAQGMTFAEPIFASDARPGTDRLEQLGGEGIRIPYYPIPPRTLFDLAKYSDTLRTILLALKKETFRNGIIVETLYAAKCLTCGKEYDEKPESGLCDQTTKVNGIELPCGGALYDPEDKYKTSFETHMKNVNENRQSLQEVSESAHQDIGIIDDGFMLILKDYYFDAAGEITNAEIKELLRGDPILMRVIADRQGRPGRNDVGDKVYTCIEHRTQVWTDREKCPDCGKRLYQAFYKADMETTGAMGQDGKRGIYYIEGEVIHHSLYNPSLTYGFSPIATAWQKIVTLLYQDTYIKEYYGKERPPRGLLFINTSNNQSLQKSWQVHRDLMRKNPHDIYPIGVEFPKEGSGKMVDWVEFVKPLTDMQYVETRNEYRRTIGALWGVQPIFQGDIQQSGGLNNEGLQVTVTNRAVESNQECMNRYLAEISRQFGLIEHGWIAKCAPVEIKDAMSDELLKAQKITNAAAMKGVGYDAELKNREMDFEFKKTVTPPASFMGAPPPGSPGSAVTSPPTINPGAQQPMEASGSPMKSADAKKKENLLNLYRDEADTAMKSNPGFVCKATPKEDRLDALEKDIYKKSFEGLSKETSDKIRDYLVDASLRRISYSDMAKKVSEISGLSDEDADRIVRTEIHELRNKSRELAYQETQPEDAKYKWVSISDDRRTSVCKKITERTSNGVTLAELKNIVREEGEREGFKPRDFSPHINCRSTFVRYFA